MDAFVAEYKAGGGVISREIECDGRAILPGFVDSHTHAVFAGDRCHEMKMKLAGATYVEVHKAGGGINFTVGSLQTQLSKCSGVVNTATISFAEQNISLGENTWHYCAS